MKKINFVLVVLATMLTAVSFGQDKPNVIVIMTDDMGNNIANLGNPWLKTPNMDKLGDESTLLTNFHQDMMCTPSRASIMTGKYALRTGAWRTSVGRSHMPTEEITMAEVFKENGYKTGNFGKWHLGDQWPFRAMDQGFDETVNLKCGGIGQVSDYWGNDYFDDTYYHNGKAQQYEGFCTDVFFGETIRFIKECKESNDPFMIYLAPNVTHLPRIVGEEYSQPFLDKGHNKNQAIYYGMITNLDENFGRLMAALKEQGIADNTIIVFTTDDGTAGYAAQFDENGWALENGFNLGQRGGKGSPYEGGHRLFSYIKWSGGKIEGGKKIDEMTSVMDVFPTLMDLCEISPTSGLDLDGISFKEVLYGDKIKDRTLVFSKMTPNKADDHKKNRFCVAQDDWRWINRTELYNVKEDRAQKNNIAEKHPEIIKELEIKLEEYLQNNAQDREVPVRFILGDEDHKKISLTTQDLWGKSAFSQGHVRDLAKGSGPWKVNFMQSGKYRFTLSRFPLYTKLPFNEKVKGKKSKEFTANLAKITIDNKNYETEVVETDTHVSFEIDVKKGEADLETWILSVEGITIPSYYVDVELIK